VPVSTRFSANFQPLSGLSNIVLGTGQPEKMKRRINPWGGSYSVKEEFSANGRNQRERGIL
jgi:hypothetical protein